MDFPDRLLHRLKQTPLTANLSESEQQQLLELSSYCEAEAGQLVFAEGSPSDHLWLLLEGEGERLQEAESGQLLLLGGVRAGDTLAALDFLLERPYSSSLRATSDCSLFMIHRQHWQRLLNGSRVGSKLALRLVAMAQQHFEQGLAATEALLETYQQAIALLRPPESSEEGVDYSLWAQIQESRDLLEKQQQMLRKQLPLATPKPTRSPSRWGPFLAGTVTGMVILGGVGAIVYGATGFGSNQSSPQSDLSRPDSHQAREPRK